MKQTAVEKAYAWVRQNIVDGSLKSGTFIDEATVCDATGVSRTPAREAFNRLEGERFITLVPRRGAQVRELNWGDLRDAYGARFMIESFAVAEFCSRPNAVLPVSMVENLEIMESFDSFDDIEAFYTYQAADQAFHGAVVETLNNRATLEFFSTLWRVNQLAMFRRSSAFMNSDSHREYYKRQHRDIYQALSIKDAEAVTELLRSHLSFDATEFALQG